MNFDLPHMQRFLKQAYGARQTVNIDIECASFDASHLFKEPKPMLDLTKPIKTRSGKAARVIATDRHTISPVPYPIIALVRQGSGSEVPYSYTRDGEFLHGAVSPDDLVNPVQPGPRLPYHRERIALALGIPVQYYHRGVKTWKECKNPSFAEGTEYRVHPDFDHLLAVYP